MASYAAPYRAVGLTSMGKSGYGSKRGQSSVKAQSKLAHGVQDPYPLQSGITQMVRCTTDIAHRSADPTITYAPYSDEDAVHTVMRGEWCFARVEDFVDRGQRKVLAGDASMSIFTNANGLKFTDKLKIGGFVGNASESAGVNAIRDQHGTIYVHGTVCGTNTGKTYLNIAQYR